MEYVYIFSFSFVPTFGRGESVNMIVVQNLSVLQQAMILSCSLQYWYGKI